MITDKSEQRDRRYANMRSIKDYGMGVLYLAVAVIMFFPEKVGLGTLEVDPIVRYIFGSICIIYGAWRLYRGYKKDYFKS